MKSHYKLLVDKAYLMHQNGELEKAEALYSKLLEINPDDANVLNLFGLLSVSMKNYERAISLLSKAFLCNKSSYVAENLAKAYYMNNEVENAVKIYKQALLYGQNDDIYYSLAIAYKKLGKKDEVINSYLKAVELNPKNYNAVYNLALAYSDLGDNDKAVYYALKAYNLNNKDVDILTLLSGFYEALENYSEAVKYLEEAVRIAPDKSVYFYNLGVLYSKLSNINESAENYKKAILVNPKQVEAYVNLASLYKTKQPEFALECLKKAYETEPHNETVALGLAQMYKDLGKNIESCEVLNKILQNNPESAEAYSLLAINSMDKCEYENALNYSLKALEISPDNLNFLHGKALALKYLGKFDEAEKILEKVVESPKSDNRTKIALGMMYLQQQNMSKGMPLYLKRNEETALFKLFGDKLYNFKDDLKDKNVLVYSNCGLGDTVMYSRFLPALSQLVKNVTVQTDKELIDFLSFNFPQIKFLLKSEKYEEFDVVIPFMDLQYALKIDFKDLPLTQSYLNADENKVKNFADLEIFKNKKLRVGLFWQGNRKIFKNRSVPFELIQKFVNNNDFDFYSFQMEDFQFESNNIFSLKNYIKDFTDTAALLKNVDVIVTIDSSVAHVAGALGIKTFLLLPHTAEWRWFFDEEKTIWYNNVRIFKQIQPNNWDEVLKRVSLELNNYANK